MPSQRKNETREEYLARRSDYHKANYEKEWAYYLANRERILARCAAYRLAQQEKLAAFLNLLAERFGQDTGSGGGLTDAAGLSTPIEKQS
jgi:hypothetical protein